MKECSLAPSWEGEPEKMPSLEGGLLPTGLDTPRAVQPLDNRVLQSMETKRFPLDLLTGGPCKLRVGLIWVRGLEHTAWTCVAGRPLAGCMTLSLSCNHFVLLFSHQQNRVIILLV